MNFFISDAWAQAGGGGGGGLLGMAPLVISLFYFISYSFDHNKRKPNNTRK